MRSGKFLYERIFCLNISTCPGQFIGLLKNFDIEGLFLHIEGDPEDVIDDPNDIKDYRQRFFFFVLLFFIHGGTHKIHHTHAGDLDRILKREEQS